MISSKYNKPTTNEPIAIAIDCSGLLELITAFITAKTVLMKNPNPNKTT